MKFKSSVLVVAFLTAQVACFAQTTSQKLEKAYALLAADPQAKYALTALCVLDGNTGKPIYTRNADVGMATASTLKTITSATAFSLLGEDFKYETTLAHNGKIENGVLTGDLLIVGGGDPTLGSSRYSGHQEKEILTQWTQAIKKAGIQRINGRIIGDDSAWGSSSLPEGWTWQDMGNYYGAAPSALSWRENQFDIRLRPGAKAGQPVTLGSIIPAMPYLKIVNELTTGEAGTGDGAYAYLPPLSSIAYLRGTWGLGIAKQGISAALPDPAYDVAYRLQETLKDLGIECTAPVTTARKLKADNDVLPTGLTKLHTIASPSLARIVYWFNKKSINLYGENLIKTIALKAGKPATTGNGVNATLNYWANKGVDKRALNMYDGSGLSPATRVTANAMAAILFQSQKESWFPAFYQSLPENNGMQLKSGSINDVSAYAGYYTNKSGQKYVAVIIINNYNGAGINKKLFKVLDALK